ncbi:MAG: signal peptidase I [Lachnospiraceae bacterium]|nr:signal peptidase I [Lachnospiraceae bacterium]
MGRKNKGLCFYHRRKKISAGTVKEIFSWMFSICVLTFIAFVLVYFGGMTTSMIGVSMEPSVQNGDTVYIDRFTYILGEPKQGDVIVFLPNGNEKSHYYIKRVVAVPGDTVQIIGGRLYVNNEIEPTGEIALDRMTDAGIAENAIVLGNDEYFVLGDNRNNSEDSRSANIGMVKKEHILGRAWFYRGGSGNVMGFVK